MLSKRYKSTEVDRRTWLHVPSGTPWCTSSDTQQVVEGKIEKVPRGIRGEKSSKDMASSRNSVSTIGALASPKIWIETSTEMYTPF